MSVIPLRTPVITERGWPGHFILAERCVWRRNTLISLGERRVVVSGVGRCLKRNAQHRDVLDPIGSGNRMMECCAFVARWDAPYWEADIAKQLKHVLPWAMCSSEREDTLAYEKIHNNIVGYWARELESLSDHDWQRLTGKREDS